MAKRFFSVGKLRYLACACCYCCFRCKRDVVIILMIILLVSRFCSLRHRDNYRNCSRQSCCGIRYLRNEEQRKLAKIGARASDRQSTGGNRSRRTEVNGWRSRHRMPSQDFVSRNVRPSLRPSITELNYHNQRANIRSLICCVSRKFARTLRKLDFGDCFCELKRHACRSCKSASRKSRSSKFKATTLEVQLSYPTKTSTRQTLFCNKCDLHRKEFELPLSITRFSLHSSDAYEIQGTDLPYCDPDKSCACDEFDKNQIQEDYLERSERGIISVIIRDCRLCWCNLSQRDSLMSGGAKVSRNNSALISKLNTSIRLKFACRWLLDISGKSQKYTLTSTVIMPPGRFVHCCNTANQNKEYTVRCQGRNYFIEVPNADSATLKCELRNKNININAYSQTHGISLIIHPQRFSLSTLLANIDTKSSRAEQHYGSASASRPASERPINKGTRKLLGSCERVACRRCCCCRCYYLSNECWGLVASMELSVPLEWAVARQRNDYQFTRDKLASTSINSNANQQDKLRLQQIRKAHLSRTTPSPMANQGTTRAWCRNVALQLQPYDYICIDCIGWLVNVARVAWQQIEKQRQRWATTLMVSSATVISNWGFIAQCRAANLHYPVEAYPLSRKTTVLAAWTSMCQIKAANSRVSLWISSNKHRSSYDSESSNQPARYNHPLGCHYIGGERRCHHHYHHHHHHHCMAANWIGPWLRALYCQALGVAREIDKQLANAPHRSKARSVGEPLSILLFWLLLCWTAAWLSHAFQATATTVGVSQSITDAASQRDHLVLAEMSAKGVTTAATTMKKETTTAHLHYNQEASYARRVPQLGTHKLLWTTETLNNNDDDKHDNASAPRYLNSGDSQLRPRINGNKKQGSNNRERDGCYISLPSNKNMSMELKHKSSQMLYIKRHNSIGLNEQQRNGRSRSALDERGDLHESVLDSAIANPSDDINGQPSLVWSTIDRARFNPNLDRPASFMLKRSLKKNHLQQHQSQHRSTQASRARSLDRYKRVARFRATTRNDSMIDNLGLIRRRRPTSGHQDHRQPDRRRHRRRASDGSSSHRGLLINSLSPADKANRQEVGVQRHPWYQQWLNHSSHDQRVNAFRDFNFQSNFSIIERRKRVGLRQFSSPSWPVVQPVLDKAVQIRRDKFMTSALVNRRHQGRDAKGAATSASSNCPQQCFCVWKNGKHFADCSDKRLTNLPEVGLNSELQVLNISANPLYHLRNLTFDLLNLNNLQRVYMSNCQLESIEPSAFYNLTLIVELDFSWNKLLHVPLPQIGHLALMRRLMMRGNPLGALTDSTFSGGLQTYLGTIADRASHAGAEADLLNNANSSGPESIDLVQENEMDAPKRNMGRLVETYPELARSLLSSARTSGDDDAANQVNVINRRKSKSLNADRWLAALEWWAAKDEPVSAEDVLAAELSSAAAEIDSVEAEGGVQAADLGTESSSRLTTAGFVRSFQLGRHFAQLQELDFGQCKLTYIKWTALDRLFQLKRLMLDGNQLSQLSGKLVASLPIGLHQLSLEDNPWRCDCRLLALKQWLLSTNTPLNAPVKCHSTSWSIRGAHRLDGRWRQQQSQNNLHISPSAIYTPTKKELINWTRRLPESLQTSSTNFTRSAHQQDVLNTEISIEEKEGDDKRVISYYLDQFVSTDLACAPQALEASILLNLDRRMSSKPIKATEVRSIQKTSNLHLNSVYHYLEPTLIKQPTMVCDSNNLAITDGCTIRQPDQMRKNKMYPANTKHKETVHVKEGDQVVLTCSILVYPEFSADIIWLADFNHHDQPWANIGKRPVDLDLASNKMHSKLVPDNAGRLPDEERFIVLYDSKLQRLNTIQNIGNHSQEVNNLFGPERLDRNRLNLQPSADTTWTEVILLGGRWVIRESKTRSNMVSIIKEAQIVIQAAHVNDSARYKCLALNKAGDSSTEYVVRVSRSDNPSREPSQILKASSSALDTSHNSPTNQDQTGQSSNIYIKNMEVENNKVRVPSVQSSQITQSGNQQTNAISISSTQGTWLKNSKTFQITIVIVSLLMAGVILAFLLFCVVIYQIKPESSCQPTHPNLLPIRSCLQTRQHLQMHQAPSLTNNVAAQPQSQAQHLIKIADGTGSIRATPTGYKSQLIYIP